MPVIAFLRFRGSRAGLFDDLSCDEFCPLRHSLPSVELRFPPQISHEKTAPSDSAELVAGRQSLRKNIAILPPWRLETVFRPQILVRSRLGNAADAGLVDRFHHWLRDTRDSYCPSPEKQIQLKTMETAET
jgi:hypothetical protein